MSLSGGEFPALVLIDAVSRAFPVSRKRSIGDIGDFQGHLLEYTQYTRLSLYGYGGPPNPAFRESRGNTEMAKERVYQKDDPETAGSSQRFYTGR